MTFLGNHALAPGKAVEAAVNTFNERNKNIHVEWVLVTEGYNQKLQTLVAGGQPPDMFRLGGPEFASYVYCGFMHDLDEYMKRDNFDRDDFSKVAFEMIFYNVNLWKDAKLPDPKKDWSPGGWAFDDFAKMAQALTKMEGSRTSQFGFVNILDWMNWPIANGGSLWNDDSTKSSLHNPAELASFQFLQDLMYKYKVAQTKEQAADLAPAQAFLTGKSA